MCSLVGMAITPKDLPTRRSRPRNRELLVPCNWKLPVATRKRLADYARSVNRSAAWVLCDLIDTLPSSLAAKETPTQG